MRAEKDNWFLYHLSNYILTFSNLFTEGITNLSMVVPALFASLFLVILSPLYYYTNIGFTHALSLGLAGLINVPFKLVIGIFQILFSPIAYPFIVYTESKNKPKKKNKKKDDGIGGSNVVFWNPNVS